VESSYEKKESRLSLQSGRLDPLWPCIRILPDVNLTRRPTQGELAHKAPMYRVIFVIGLTVQVVMCLTTTG